MIHALTLLAQATAPNVSRAVPPRGWLAIPFHWPAQADLLTWFNDMSAALGLLLLLLGLVYLLFGFYLFKPLVMLNAAFVGAVVGVMVSRRFGGPVPCAILGGFISAAVTYPLMKWAVAVMGGLFGAVLGVTLWKMFGFEPGFAWTGAMMGLIAFGLFCFILFRGSVMAYTSLQGSVMVVFGVLSLAYKYSWFAETLSYSFRGKPFLLPMTVFIATILGLIYQQNSQLANGAAAAQGPKK